MGVGIFSGMGRRQQARVLGHSCCLGTKEAGIWGKRSGGAVVFDLWHIGIHRTFGVWPSFGIEWVGAHMAWGLAPELRHGKQKHTAVARIRAAYVLVSGLRRFSTGWGDCSTTVARRVGNSP
jgi:hypothetical protein